MLKWKYIMSHIDKIYQLIIAQGINNNIMKEITAKRYVLSMGDLEKIGVKGKIISAIASDPEHSTNACKTDMYGVKIRDYQSVTICVEVEKDV